MKLNGETPEQNLCILVLPRPNKDVIFQARPITDVDEFEKLCPEIKPPEKILPGGSRQPNFEDPGYKDADNRRSEKRLHWFVIRSLEATPGLTWDRVIRDDPETWPLWREELKEAGFASSEIGRIRNLAFEANSLDDAKIDEARKRFLAGMQVQKDLQTSQKAEA